MPSLPTAWQQAFVRDAQLDRPVLAGPLPERRLARLLAACIASGLFFLVLPGTLVGVWNLIRISSERDAATLSPVWLQAHGHAQLFGWVGTFIIGISLYTLPKFRGAFVRSVPVGWGMWAVWTAAVLARWAAALRGREWGVVFSASAAAELAVAFALIWQCSAAGRRRGRRELWDTLVFAGFFGLVLTLALQLWAVRDGLRQPLIPADANATVLWLAVWAFCFPVVWGYSTRFLPSFLGLGTPRRSAAHAGLLATVGATAALLTAHPRAAALLIVAAVALACWSLRIFHPAERIAKTGGIVDPIYPWFARAAFAWLAVSALLAAAGESHGMTGASRHAFTVGFLAGLIFSLGPRILPSFLNSRELWSVRLMRWSMALLCAGCALRVISEPLAYSGRQPAAWQILPVSAVLELTAVLLFAWNIGATLLSKMPAWIEARTVKPELALYWFVTAYPETRPLLENAGLTTLRGAREVPKSLTLREAAVADGADCDYLLALLRDYFDRRQARTLRMKTGLRPE